MACDIDIRRSATTTTTKNPGLAQQTQILIFQLRSPWKRDEKRLGMDFHGKKDVLIQYGNLRVHFKQNSKAIGIHGQIGDNTPSREERKQAISAIAQNPWVVLFFCFLVLVQHKVRNKHENYETWNKDGKVSSAFTKEEGLISSAPFGVLTAWHCNLATSRSQSFPHLRWCFLTCEDLSFLRIQKSL